MEYYSALREKEKEVLPFATTYMDLKDITLSEVSQTSVNSVAQSRLTLCDPMDCGTPGLPVICNSQNSLKFVSIESVMPSNHLILFQPLLLLLSIFPRIRVLFKESVLHIRWPKDWSFSFNISPSSEYPGLISFRMDWLDLLVEKT